MAIQNRQNDISLPSRGVVDDRNTLESQMIGADTRKTLTSIVVAQARDYLAGMEYPASKVGLFRFAQKAGAPEIVLQSIDKLPPKSYRTLRQVTNDMKIFSRM